MPEGSDEGQRLTIAQNTRLPNVKPFAQNPDLFQQGIDFENYIDTFELHCEFLSIQSQERRKTALLLVGGNVITFINRNQPPTYPEGLSSASTETEKKARCYDILIATLSTHLRPYRNKLYHRYKFSSLRQKTSETVADFYLRLKDAAKYCQFETNTIDTRLMEQIIIGLVEDEIRQKCFREELSLTDLLKYAASFETSRSQAKIFTKNNGQMKAAHAVNAERSENVKCSNCGRYKKPNGEHKCPAKNAKCHACKLVGHFKMFCRKTNGGKNPIFTQKSGKSQHVQNKKKSANSVDVNDSSNDVTPPNTTPAAPTSNPSSSQALATFADHSMGLGML